MTFCD